MTVLRFILRVIGWLVTIIIQIALSYLIIFLFSILFAGVDTTSRPGWLASLLLVWAGYVIGINLAGLAALHWVWKKIQLFPYLRLVGSAIGALIPLLILLPIGFSVPVGDTGTSFYDLVTNNWQPILVQASLLVAVAGYYAPGLLNFASRSTRRT